MKVAAASVALLVIVLALIWIVSFAIPVLGPLVFTLLSPVFFAGLMIACRAVDSGEELELAHLFAGFRTNASALVTIGGVYLVGTIVVLGVVLLVSGGSMLTVVQSKSDTNLETLAGALRSFLLAMAVGSAVYIPLLMLIWFAPLLVVFEGMPPAAAMRLSFAACWRNMVPFLIYGLVILGLWFVASIPLLLGLVVLLPVLFCSVYASYRDIFAAAPGPAAPGADNPFLR